MRSIPIPSLIILSYISITTYLTVQFSGFFAFMFIAIFLTTIVDVITSAENSSVLTIRTLLLLFSGRIKRVNTEYGRFFISIKRYGNNKIAMVLYQDRFFFLKELGWNFFYDTESMKVWIKSIYDEKYKEKEDLNSMISEIKKWNGFIDKSDERNSKIEDLIN